MCEICGREIIKHQCKGDCNKHGCDGCGYKCAGKCGYAICSNCHRKRMEARISPEKTHYYCNNCIKRYDMS